jgi:hypothetical protein
VAVLALVLAYVALVAAYVALRTLAKLRRTTTILSRGARGARERESMLEAAGRHAELVGVLGEQVRELREYVEQARSEDAAALAEQVRSAGGSLRHVALVRYDAFADLSGRMSFSLALLDEHGDGVTISSLAGRSDTRTYAKSVTGGRGEQDLSPEESQAVEAALAGTAKRSLLGRKAS